MVTSIRTWCVAIGSAVGLAVCCAGNSLSADMFTYSDFGSVNDLSLVGDAAQVGSVLRLNASLPDDTGAAWHVAKHSVAGGFETVFDFQITDLKQFNVGETGGDGFAFVVQNNGTTAIGNTGFYMGYEIENSLAVEFDTFNNYWWPTAPATEPNSNHVGVQSRGTNVNTPSWTTSTLDAYLGHAVVAPNMSDGAVHSAKITYVPGTLAVFVDDLDNAALTVQVDLDSLLDLDAGMAYVGFTAGGDTATENHDITSWGFESVPEPSPLALLGGLLVMGMVGYWSRRRRQAT